jgi:hypothetical protein
LDEALRGFAKLRAHADAAEVLYLISRTLHSTGDVPGRDDAAALFVAAEAAAVEAAARPAGARARFAEPGAIETHLEELALLDREAAEMYARRGKG